MSSFSPSGGFAYGVALTLLVLYGLNWIRRRFKAVQSFFRPQTVAHQTGKSPFRVFVDLLGNTFLLAVVAYLAVQAVRLYVAGQ